MPLVAPLPDGFTARPLAADDIPAVAALLGAAEEVDDTGEHFDADDLAEWWVDDLVDLAADGLAVCGGADGHRVVGYATAIAPPTFRGAFSVHLEGRVHPAVRGRGLGSVLLAWQLERGAEIHRERHPEVPARLTVLVPETMPALAALAERHQLAQTRAYRIMERPLDELPDLAPPPGVHVVPFSWDRDDEVRRAHNTAFSEHFGSSERDPASWQVMFTGQRAFRPELSMLALADGALAAYALVYVYDSDTRATGVQRAHFGQIGTLPEFRGRGLAPAVITAAQRAAVAADCALAELQVDSENVTGALRLYQRLGFSVRRTRIAWARALPPVAPRAPRAPSVGSAP